jgi:putative ABC transport system ATP-binding protein
VTASIVRFEQVSRTYPGPLPVHALIDASFSINAGEMVAVVGPSGSGKSTLLGILGCLDAPTEGKVTIAGLDATALGDAGRSKLRRDFVGFVFQQFHLIPHATALRNVEAALLYRGLSRHERRKMAGDALEVVGLGGRQHHLPAKLSGGEQQRVALARAVVTQPSLIVADEPTGNLDTTTASLVLDLLRTFVTESTAVVVVTHDPAIAARADRTIEMLDGRILPVIGAPA